MKIGRSISTQIATHAVKVISVHGWDASGDFIVGAKKLKFTTVQIKEVGGNELLLTNFAEDAYYGARFQDVSFKGSVKGLVTPVVVRAGATDGAVLELQAKKGGINVVNVARLVGAAVPYFEATLPMLLIPYTGAITAIEGILGYDGDDDRLKYRDAAGEKIISANRELLVPPLGTGTYSERGYLIDGAGDSCVMCLIIPQDFLTLQSIEVIFLPEETGADMHFDITTRWAAGVGGEDYNVHTETADARDIGATVDTQYLVHSISDLVDVAALAPGDILAVQVLYDAAAVDSNAYIRGLRFRYT